MNRQNSAIIFLTGHADIPTMNKEIARELGTTERTIKAHRQQVMEKMKVTSLAELVMIAERLGVLAVGNKARMASN